MGAPGHGKNALIYVSTSEIVGGNAWSINFEVETADTPQFGDVWKKTVKGLRGWAGSISAWDQGDDQVLQAAAISDASVALLIYPRRSDLTSYYSGNANFGFSGEGSTGGPVGNSADFTGDDTLTIEGFD